MRNVILGFEHNPEVNPLKSEVRAPSSRDDTLKKEKEWGSLKHNIAMETNDGIRFWRFPQAQAVNFDEWDEAAPNTMYPDLRSHMKTLETVLHEKGESIDAYVIPGEDGRFSPKPYFLQRLKERFSELKVLFHEPRMDKQEYDDSICWVEEGEEPRTRAFDPAILIRRDEDGIVSDSPTQFGFADSVDMVSYNMTGNGLGQANALRQLLGMEQLVATRRGAGSAGR